MTTPSVSIAPWLNVSNSVQALTFYTGAFGATETYRLDLPDGAVIARLSIHGAEFWIADESPDSRSPLSLGGGSVRLILTVADPDALFAQVLAAGAIQVYPVGEQHGWRIGRLVDPFGHQWEIGRPV